jgi:hypothetical protein
MRPFAFIYLSAALSSVRFNKTSKLVNYNYCKKHFDKHWGPWLIERAPVFIFCLSIKMQKFFLLYIHITCVCTSCTMLWIHLKSMQCSTCSTSSHSHTHTHTHSNTHTHTTLHLILTHLRPCEGCCVHTYKLLLFQFFYFQISRFMFVVRCTLFLSSHLKLLMIMKRITLHLNNRRLVV